METDDYDEHCIETRERDTVIRPILIFGDNRGSIFTAGNPEISSNSKHLEVRYYKIREYIRQNLLRVRYCHTADNLADMFTKGLERIKFTRFARIIMNAVTADPSSALLGNAALGRQRVACWDVRGDESTVSTEAVMITVGHIPSR